MNRRLATVLGVLVLVASLAGVAAVAPAAPDETDHTDRSLELREALTFGGIKEHLERLQAFADISDGNRASGFDGFDLSADYVARKLERYGWRVRRQPFAFDVFIQRAPSVFEQTAPEAATYVENEEYSTMEYSGSGEVTAELVAVDLKLPPTPEPSSTSGCEPSDFTGLDVTGKVALMQRGSCDFAVKVQNAADAGAAAAVIFNEGQEGRTDVIFGTLGELAEIPAVDTDFALGEDLANEVLNGPTGTTVHIATLTRSETRSTENVIASTRTGNPDDVVIAGAHLDSVVEGPGINDNGSGSATLVELAHQISELGIKPENKLRFTWWGAEESNLDGSTYFVEQLSQARFERIALYLNLDMIGSPNFGRFIYDGNGSKFEVEGPPGSAAIERTFERYFDSQDLASGQTAFDGRSDYGPFIDVGIPSGGLFTGAEEIKTEAEQDAYGGTEGEAFDPCYHQACDDIDNISRRGLRQMSDATAHAVNHYAFDLKFIPRPERGAARVTRDSAGTSGEYLGDLLRK